MTRRRSRWPALAALPLLAACASGPDIPDTNLLDKIETVESTPLGGEALSLRKRELQRAHHDLGHFTATIETLRQRHERSGMILFSQFVDSYMGRHLDPLMRHLWQSSHPELMALDAGLRLAQADLLIQMHAPGRVQKVINEIESRYPGREGMLVEYPIGGQTTLGQALTTLRGRKWRG